MNNNELISCGLAAVTILGGCGIAYGINVHHDNTLKNMPESYWEAQKAEKDVEYKKHLANLEYRKEKDAEDRKANAEKAEADHRRAMEKQASLQEFEKNQPPEYWTYKAAEREARSREYAAEQERKAKNYESDRKAEAQKEQYREMRRMFDTAAGSR